MTIPEGAKALAIQTARDAGAILREMLGRVTVEFKGTVDLVTDADRASETLIGSRIAGAFPDHRLVGEEGIARDTGSGDDDVFTWIVDPLDGTTNFAHGYPHFAVSIALAFERTVLLGVVYDPMRDELFVAERGAGATLNDRPIRVSTTSNLIHALLATGFSYDLSLREGQLAIWNVLQGISQGIRRDGAAALNLCYVGAGRLDGFWEQPLQPWDMAAGSLIVEEAGGVVTDYRGGPFSPFDAGAIAGNASVHRAILDAILPMTGDAV
ncbi:MAG: inositol monophosphatase [Thermomicrobiales bacterium]|nr:inositol monophosphatase [Thermomicrobiales bacterium]